jgi:hypothetical protein
LSKATIRVLALMREDTNENAQPLYSAWTTPTRGVANVAPAPMREDDLLFVGKRDNKDGKYILNIR